MKGSRPDQAVLTKNTDMSKTNETRRVVESMVDGLNDHRIADIIIILYSCKILLNY